MMRFLYRASQFFHAIQCKPTRNQLSCVQSLLPAELYSLFKTLSPADQCHSIAVYETLCSQRERDLDLLMAAVLHDVGKSRFRLHVLERVLIVLSEGYIPEKTRIWGEGKPRGLKRAFVIAQQHPEWGADMVSSAGGSKTLVRLIREHQTLSTTSTGDHFSELLQRLQRADSLN